ncbi:YibE/F family protein [Virgibacillus soli]|uniref:YibE/F family protein n=1 Tax=Paracerasibacillus soli TaxID=480284 RepID=A0ABU5CUY5_9BACI|nr:YibE/F family protein [Virgibacillus soli]MDY0409255.1 YibE/F family protein [Virgibacillus soli]
MTYKRAIFYLIIFLLFISSLIFVHHNYTFYNQTIAKVVETKIEETTEVTDQYENKDTLYTQHIVAEIKNGEHKGKQMILTNEYSNSGAYDYHFAIGNELFVKIDKNAMQDSATITGDIIDVKRDKYLVIIAWIFFFTLLIVGKKQGLFASVSLVVNIMLLSYALDFYIKTNTNLLWICGMTVIIFTVISLLLVNGRNEKTYAAIIATLLGTFFAVFVTYLAMWVTNENGLRYEEMQFLTRPYHLIFLAGLFIGSLGAVMDVAISISSAIFELYEKNHDIPIQQLKKSGFDIGKDIMGTMTNILFFAYVSGSIPMLILYISNYSPLGFTLTMNLSLELARALAGGIGIVITIPIGLYTTIFFVNRKRAKQ